MQRYLHDNIELKELEKYTILGTRNVKTHYNAFKRDIMFTYYNNDKIWNICYNEALGKWITRYSWAPLMSENIDHSMFSFDLLRTRAYGLLNTNLNRSQSKNDCYVTYSNSTPGKIKKDDNDILLELNINKPYTYYNVDSIQLKAFYWDRVHKRVKYDILNNGLNYSLCNVIIEKYNHNNDDEVLAAENKMYEYWVDNVKGKKHEIKFNVNDIDQKYLYFSVDLVYTPYTVAEIKVDDNIEIDNVSNTKEDGTNVFILGNESKSYSIGLIKDYTDFYRGNEYEDDYKNALISSIFVHGRSINADEINYFDNIHYNQCLPTK